MVIYEHTGFIAQIPNNNNNNNNSIQWLFINIQGS